MRKLRYTPEFIVILLLVGILSGCTRDPSVRKQMYFESGSRYLKKGKYREAAIQFLNALQTDPRFADAHYQLAQCYLNQSMWEAAYGELMRTVDLAPKNWKAHVDLGNLLLAGHELNRALQEAQLVLSEQADNVDAHVLSANAQAAMGRSDEALQEMQNAIQLAPDRAQSYLNLALLQTNAKQIAGAEENYKKAISLEPKAAGPVLALGSFYAQQRRFSEAAQEYRRAIVLDPQNPLPRAALASLAVTEGKKDEAEQILKEAKAALPDNSEGYRLLGDFYISSGDSEKAEGEYASLYQEHPKDLRVKKNYIQVLILRNRLDEATKLTDEILKSNPRDLDGLIERGQILSRQGHPDDAILAFQAALKTEPDNAVAHYYLGVAYGQSNNMQRAESEWREAARLKPNMVEAQQALALVALGKRDIGQLKRSAEAIVSAQALAPLGYVYRATARAAEGDVAGAEEDLKQSIAVAPQSPLGYTRLGELRASQGKMTEAQQLLEQALDRDPNSAEALQSLARLYLLQKQPAAALNRVNAQIAKMPGNSAFYFLAGQIRVANKDWDKAEAALAKATELNKNNVDACLLLGQVQTARGLEDRAIASYQRSIQQNPRDVRSYVLLGALQERQGEWQAAREAYERALRVEPGYPVAANNLAYLTLEHGGNVDVALSLAQVARRGLQDSPNTADTLAWAYYHKGAYATAIDLLKKALSEVPNEPTFNYHIGLAYQKSNDTVHAKQHLERALRLNPRPERADEIRKALAELSRS